MISGFGWAAPALPFAIWRRSSGAAASPLRQWPDHGSLRGPRGRTGWRPISTSTRRRAALSPGGDPDLGGGQARLVAALGPPAVAVLLFEVILNATALFSIANINLPRPVVLRLFVITPTCTASTIPSIRARPAPTGFQPAVVGVRSLDVLGSGRAVVSRARSRPANRHARVGFLAFIPMSNV